jgi:hypothetical protein
MWGGLILSHSANIMTIPHSVFPALQQSLSYLVLDVLSVEEWFSSFHRSCT